MSQTRSGYYFPHAKKKYKKNTVSITKMQRYCNFIGFHFSTVLRVQINMVQFNFKKSENIKQTRRSWTCRMKIWRKSVEDCKQYTTKLQCKFVRLFDDAFATTKLNWNVSLPANILKIMTNTIPKIPITEWILVTEK